jgi:hypothetical protein
MARYKCLPNLFDEKYSRCRKEQHAQNGRAVDLPTIVDAIIGVVAGGHAGRIAEVDPARSRPIQFGDECLAGIKGWQRNRGSSDRIYVSVH